MKQKVLICYIILRNIDESREKVVLLYSVEKTRSFLKIEYGKEKLEMTGDYFAHLNFGLTTLQARNAEPAARLTYCAILFKWNGFKRCKSFDLSDRELQNLTGLGSNATTRSKRKLKNLGLIDFKANRNGTKYFFTETPNTHYEVTDGAPTDTQTARSAVFPTTYTSNHKKKEEKAHGREEEIWEL